MQDREMQTTFLTDEVPVREFLGWDKPLLASVTAWLMAKREDLSSMLVVVPTSNSGRRLRMELSADGGVLAPHVMPPSRLFDVDAVATRQESLWAWVQAIRGIDVADFPHLFPNHAAGSIRGFGAALALAKQMMALRDGLADGDAGFRDAQQQSPEKERWQELVNLETKMLKYLGTWKLRDSVLAKRDKAQQPVLPTGVTQIIVACVPDPTRLASRALENFLTNGVPVTVLVHAPEAEASVFDVWGSPLTDHWVQEQIDIPAWRERLHVTDSSTEAAEVCRRVIAEEKSSSDDTALALCDSTFAPALEKVFSEAGWALYDPEGTAMADTGIMRALRLMRELSGRQRSFTALREWVRLPGAEKFLPLNISRHSAAKQMDRLHLDHLPETVADALFLATDYQKKILEPAVAKLDELTMGKLADNLRVWLSDLLDGADDTAAMAVEASLAEALDALERIESYGEKPSAEEAFEMLAESVQGAKIPSERVDTILDLQGWLELSYDPAPHLVLAGMHEECVPDGSADDAFLPDSLRKKLGLRDSRGRFARDAFLLKSFIEARVKSGRVDAVIARFNDAGEARKPSRLLMRQRGVNLAKVVTHLFSESKSSRSNGGAWQRDWTLDFPHMDNPYTADPARSISPSAIKDYLNCPMRFFLKRIVGMKPYEFGKREMNAFDFGNLCHVVVDAFGKDANVRDSSDTEEINAYFSDMLDLKIKDIYGSQISLPLMVQVESARERLRAFASRQAEDRAGGWCILETEFIVGEGEAPWQIADHPVKMTIDRIDRNEDGKSWRVWDYKTSGKAKFPQEQHHATWLEKENRPLLGELIPAKGRSKERRWAEVQLPMYAAFIQQHFKTSELPQVGYINLPRAVSDVQLCGWRNFDNAMLDHAMTWAEAAVRDIKEGKFSQAAVYPANQKDWDDFSELAPDGLAAAFHGTKDI